MEERSVNLRVASQLTEMMESATERILSYNINDIIPSRFVDSWGEYNVYPSGNITSFTTTPSSYINTDVETELEQLRAENYRLKKLLEQEI